MSKGKYSKMAKIKQTRQIDGKDEVSYRPFITGAKGRSHEYMISRASQHGVELGEEGVDFHKGQHPSNGLNELHGGLKIKCKRGCASSPKVSHDSNTNKIILRTPAIDSRQGRVPNVDDLKYYSVVHIRDVQHLMLHVLSDMISDVMTHDWTKLSNTDDFLENMMMALEGGKFKSGKWWKLHVSKERHHPIDYTGPHKTMLQDIIHMLCDWVAAGNARSDKGVNVADSLLRNHNNPKDMKELLYKAFINTFEYLNSEVVVLKNANQLSNDVPDLTDNEPKASSDVKGESFEPKSNLESLDDESLVKSSVDETDTVDSEVNSKEEITDEFSGKEDIQ